MAWLDDWPIRELKTIVDDLFWKDFESSDERTDFYCDTITAAQWRIAITHWVWEAYEKVNSKSTALFRSAQHVGFANCRCGCENDKIRVANLRSYEVGLETDPPMEKLSKEEAENLALMDKAQRLQERKEK